MATARRLDVGCADGLTEIVTGLAARGGLGPRETYRLRLAADELTTNIAMHGYQGRGGVVEVEWGVLPDGVWLRIGDTAPRFDPRTHDPRPRLAAGPDHAEEGGLGLFLALRSLDHFAYHYDGNRNINTLVVRRGREDDDGAGGVGGGQLPR